MRGAAAWVPTTVAVVVGSACATPPSALGTATAEVSIADGSTERYPVTCSQLKWQWIIETAEDGPGFTAIVNTGATVTAELVHLDGVGGFSGTFGRDVVGDGQASVDDGVFLITGNAFGETAADPAEMVYRGFTIRTEC
ncbi:MAG: lipoprotein LpqH [Actinomycetota bacterium]|nr:lipoprotein LpqH [Actinomycetota bacterium]